MFTNATDPLQPSAISQISRMEKTQESCRGETSGTHPAFLCERSIARACLYTFVRLYIFSLLLAIARNGKGGSKKGQNDSSKSFVARIHTGRRCTRFSVNIDVNLSSLIRGEFACAAFSASANVGNNWRGTRNENVQVSGKSITGFERIRISAIFGKAFRENG